MASKTSAKPKARKPRAREPVAKPKADNPSSLAHTTYSQQSNRRPTEYTPELGDLICELLADGQTLSAICKNPAMPAERTVRSWARDAQHPISPYYARARAVGYDSWGDQMRDKVANCTADVGEVAKVRLEVDTMKWLLSKALPRVYGDKLEIDTPADGGLAKAAAVTTAALAALVERR